jgi:hypothetical protein
MIVLRGQPMLLLSFDGGANLSYTALKFLQ